MNGAMAERASDDQQSVGTEGEQQPPIAARMSPFDQSRSQQER